MKEAETPTSTTKPSSPCCSDHEQASEIRESLERVRRENAVLERRLKRERRTLARLEDLREKNDAFLHQAIRELSGAEALLRERHEALEDANEELCRTQERLIESERKANHANRAKSSFLAAMSHELRTPLTAIIGYSEFLIEGRLEDRVEALDDLGRVMLSARHLLSLVNDVLDVSKIEAGHYDVALDEFDLVELVDEMLAASSVLIKKNGNTLEWDGAEDGAAPIMMYSDAKALRQCLVNLVANAAKFTRNGTIGIRCLRLGADSIEVEVSDTGIGMTSEQLEKIFEEFAQVRSKDNIGGTGLGLTITRRLLTMLNGSISVASEPGRGSRFSVRLPIRCVAEAPPVRPRRRTGALA